MTWAIISGVKSGKREVAVSLLLLWAFLTGRHFIWVGDATHTAQNEGWTTLTWAVLAWAAAAFGIDFAIKSGLLGGREPARRTTDRSPPRKGPEDFTGAP